ncbi:uncharacterized protein DFL_001327 [Arthrobotrys flagrans]|uniref:Uncharacterized protein n=1 Tax=Arthrobotrys flagrans TaxID=97331 RepID=A0A437AGU2_ARTFL|nr:hypothetical protein DFL_001327 [Arthrobotrys flagrans]
MIDIKGFNDEALSRRVFSSSPSHLYSICTSRFPSRLINRTSQLHLSSRQTHLIYPSSKRFSVNKNPLDNFIIANDMYPPRGNSQTQFQGSPGLGQGGGRSSGIPSRANSRRRYGPGNLGPHVSAEWGMGPRSDQTGTNTQSGNTQGSGNQRTRQPEVNILTMYPYSDSLRSITYQSIYRVGGELVREPDHIPDPSHEYDLPFVMMLGDWASGQPGVNREDYNPRLRNDGGRAVTGGPPFRSIYLNNRTRLNLFGELESKFEYFWYAGSHGQTRHSVIIQCPDEGAIAIGRIPQSATLAPPRYGYQTWIVDDDNGSLTFGVKKDP